MGLHFYDCYEFLTEGLSDNVVVWQGYPYSVLWYAFFFVALQVTLYPKQRKHQTVSDGVYFSCPLIFTPLKINLLCSPVSPAVSPGSPLRDLLWQLPDASLAADGQEGSVKKKIKLKKNILVPSTSLLPLETLMSTYTCK